MEADERKNEKQEDKRHASPCLGRDAAGEGGVGLHHVGNLVHESVKVGWRTKGGEERGTTKAMRKGIKYAQSPNNGAKQREQGARVGIPVSGFWPQTVVEPETSVIT